jgi:YD repeat-containing protein
MVNQFYCGDVEINCPQDQFGNCTTTIYQQTISGVAFLPAGIYEIDADVEFYHDACGATTAGGQASGFDSRFSYSSDIPGNTYKSLTSQVVCRSTDPIAADGSFVNPGMIGAFLNTGKRMVFSAWVREGTVDTAYTHNSVDLAVNGGDSVLHPVGPVVDGWQRYEGYFTPLPGVESLTLKLINNSSNTIYFDDIRIHPFNADMKSYIYDPVNLRLTAELDPNNYATFYEYDEEGTLVRVKAETRQGIKTIKETRSAKQKNLVSVQ